MKFPAIKYKQSSYNLISTVLPFDIINRNSKTLIYGIDEGGYQRKQDVKHFQNIKKYIETNNFVFPNSIILAVDESDIDFIIEKHNNDLFYLDFSKINSKIFRVVDGQHRLLGILNALDSDASLRDLQLQVSIILTPSNKRSIELDIFSNINSKAKRLRTDLIELAKYDFRIIEDKIGDKDLVPHIAINTAFNLNEDQSSENVWQNAIKIDIHSENKIGIIGVTAFRESISGIVNSYLKFNDINTHTLQSDDLIIFARNASKEISLFLNEIWKIVHNKWPKAFLNPYKELDIDNQYKSIVYDPNYYIQKTLGCKSLNYLVSDILKEANVNISEKIVMEKFSEILYKSKLTDDDWKVGKTLSGISSESGFRKVTKIIKNEENFIRKE